MTEWIAVSKSKHGNTGWKRYPNFAFAAHNHLAPLLLAELGKLLPHYVLGFLPREDVFDAVVVLSLENGANAYVGSRGEWLAPYVPSSFRGAPFAMANTPEGNQVLAIDGACLAEEGGEPLFGESGALADSVAQVLHFFEVVEENKKATARACQALADQGLITPWKVKYQLPERAARSSVAGLYCVDESVLNSLAGEALGELRDCGALGLAYGQLFSMHQLPLLATMHTGRQELQVAAPVPGFDDVFKEETALNFDFLKDIH